MTGQGSRFRSGDSEPCEAGEKQSTGITGIALSYMNSKKFLQGDGGWNSVFWMPEALLEKYAPDGIAIATEENARTMEDLKDFLKFHNR